MDERGHESWILFTLEKKRLSEGQKGMSFLSSITQTRIIEKTELDVSQTCAVKCSGFQQRTLWLDIRKMYSLERGARLGKVPTEPVGFP